MSRVRKPPTRLLVATLVVLAVMLAAESVVLAAGTWTMSGAAVKAVYTATADDSGVAISLTSSTWSDVPGMSVTVSVPPGQRALLVITFSAETSCTDDQPADALCMVQAEIDTSAARPAPVIFDSTATIENTWEANSMQWVEAVGPGDHRVVIRYLVGYGGDWKLGSRTLTVLRSKLVDGGGLPEA